MYIYLDESGDTGGASGFAVAMFFAKDPIFWSKKEENLLQVADLLVGAIRQIYFPSKNKQKVRIAKGISGLIDDRIYIWPWKPRSQ